MRFALIYADEVVNVIELAEGHDWQVPEGHRLLPAENVAIGWKVSGDSFVVPEIEEVAVQVPVIFSVTNAQLRAELIERKLLAQVQTKLEQTQGLKGEALYSAFEYAPSFSRDGMFVQELKEILSFSDEQLNELFVSANSRTF